MIDSSQLVNCLWMGMVLLMLGLVPGLYQGIGEALSRFRGELGFLFLKPVRLDVEFTPAQWFAPLGGVLIVMGLALYFIK